MIHQTEALKQAFTLLLKSRKLKTIYQFFECFGPSINAIVGRPGSNKTAILDLLIADLLNNRDENSIKSVIYHQLELPIFEIFKRGMLRDGYIDNNDDPITEEIAKQFYMANKNKDIYYIDYTYTVSEFYNTTLQWISNKDISPRTPGIVAIDHLLLFPSYEFDMLFKSLVELKKKGCIIIILSQLNRSIEDQNRRTNGSYKNIIMPSDIYASDKLYHYCDLIIAADMPATRNITLWGPSNIPITKTDIIITHLKNRNGTKKAFIYKQTKPYNIEVVRELKPEELFGNETATENIKLTENDTDSGDIFSQSDNDELMF